MPKVITAITGSYDTLKEPRVVSEGWEYICFTDHPIESKTWQTRVGYIHDRYVKINAWQYSKELTLWVDGSIEIIGDLNEFISEVGQWWTCWKHPQRNCTYDEARVVVDCKDIDELTVSAQMVRYMEAGFPRNYGLGGNGIMLRDLSDPVVVDLCKQWWEEWEAGAKRDQLSLIFTMWKNGYMPGLFDNSIMEKYFIWHSHR